MVFSVLEEGDGKIESQLQPRDHTYGETEVKIEATLDRRGLFTGFVLKHFTDDEVCSQIDAALSESRSSAGDERTGWK